MFSEPIASWLGQPLGAVLLIAFPEDCAGALELAVPVDGSEPRNLRVSGWAWDRKHRRPPVAIVVTTDAVITGVGAVGQKRTDLAAAGLGLRDSYVGYVGYVREVGPATPVNVHAVLSGSPMSACYFASTERPAQQ